MENFDYLKSYTLKQLVHVAEELMRVEAKRILASNHEKFNKDRTINGRIVKKMDFPSVNPNFTKLKHAVELELKERIGNV
jgi:hypothetical protein